MIARKSCTALFVLALTSLVAAHPVRAQGDVWTAKGLQGGFVLTLAIDPRIPTTLYASTCCSGDFVFKTTNSGDSWRAITAGLTPASVNALAIDPLMTTTLYAGWARGFGGGVHRSTDGGSGWIACGTGIKGNVRTLTV